MRFSARRGALSIGRSTGKPDRSLHRLLRNQNTKGVTSWTRYKDLNLQSRETVWDISPGRYEGIRNVDYSGMTDLVDVLDRKISDNEIGGNGQQRVG